MPMTENEFRNDPELRRLAQVIQADPTFQLIVDILMDAHPSRQRLPIRGNFDGNILLGRVYGYQEALDRIANLSKLPPELPKDVPTTWGIKDE